MANKLPPMMSTRDVKDYYSSVRADAMMVRGGGYASQISGDLSSQINPNTPPVLVSEQTALRYPQPKTIFGERIIQIDVSEVDSIGDYIVTTDQFNTYKLRNGSWYVNMNGDVCQKPEPLSIEKMGMTPEGKVKKEIKQILKDAGAYSFMPVQNGMGSPSLDFIGTMRGWAFAIEAKAEGKKPTARQQETINIMRHAGAKVFVIDGTDYSELILWLESRPDLDTLYGSV